MENMMENYLKSAIKFFKENGISQALGKDKLDKVLEWQDFIGHKRTDQIVEIWSSLEAREKETFIWICMCCLSYDMAVWIIRATVVYEERKKKKKSIANESHIEWFKEKITGYLSGVSNAYSYGIDDRTERQIEKGVLQSFLLWLVQKTGRAKQLEQDVDRAKEELKAAEGAYQKFIDKLFKDEEGNEDI